MTRFFIFFIFLCQTVFSQDQADNLSVIDKINFFFGPQYSHYTQSINLLAIKNQQYLGEPVDEKLFFGAAHIFGLASGIRGYNSKIYVYFHANMDAYSPAANLKTSLSGSVISGINPNQFLDYGICSEHYFGERFGLGIEYREVVERYTSYAYAGYADLLRMNLSKKMFFLSIPYRYSMGRFKLRLKTAFAPFIDNSEMNYQIRFSSYGDPSAPTVETGPALPAVKIKNHPYAFYLEAGIIVNVLGYIPVKISYQYYYEWTHSFYTKQANILNFIIGIPSF